jgi:hypothetical protein
MNNHSNHPPVVTHDTSNENEVADNNDQDHDRSATPTQIHVISHGSSSIAGSVVEETPIGRGFNNKTPDLDLGFARDHDILNEISNMYRLLDIINDGGKHIPFVERPNQ